jgi:hypothetical protein
MHGETIKKTPKDVFEANNTVNQQPVILVYSNL